MPNYDLCRESLDGLSVGDALGAQFFVPGTSFDQLAAGHPPHPPWPWTDDTEMACSIVAELNTADTIDQDRLATAFAQRYEPYRGYGAGSIVLLRQVRDGASWRDVSPAAFDGQGSMGNGDPRCRGGSSGRRRSGPRAPRGGTPRAHGAAGRGARPHRRQ